jgi:hypothetical protein
MGLLDSILGAATGGGAGGGVQNMVIDGIAAKFGIPPAMAEMAVAALSRAHPQPNDTIATAAQQTGIDSGILGQIVGHLGGESGLGQIADKVNSHPESASIFSQLDRDGDGSPLNDIAGLAGSLFGKK